ncbi:uncharacterized protein [Periplaneta americana]|uniref:uncharacterized protein n=1 Tax=Periplaneta americana TaxID=6978 RepID=UPI0037E92C00
MEMLHHDNLEENTQETSHSNTVEFRKNLEDASNSAQSSEEPLQKPCKSSITSFDPPGANVAQMHNLSAFRINSESVEDTEEISVSPKAEDVWVEYSDNSQVTYISTCYITLSNKTNDGLSVNSQRQITSLENSDI